MSWICDGVPKNGQNYSQAITGGHTPYENTGPDCNICGLPEEAMRLGKGQGTVTGPTTIVTKPMGSGPGTKQPSWLLPVGVIATLLILGAGGYGLYALVFSGNKTNPTPTVSASTTSDTSGFVSSKATNSNLISQGEQILLGSNSDKDKGADSFKQKDWDTAITDYQKAADADANDPETKIYLNNAKAEKAGNPLIIAVAVPGADENSAKEVLRGVSKAQEDFNNKASDRLLEVVIVKDPGGINTEAVAQDLINAPEVLGVIGHGIDKNSEAAIKKYEAAKLAVISPLTATVNDGSTPLLTVVPTDKKAGELLQDYLKSVGETLSKYAAKIHPSPKAVIFYNSASPYSQQLKKEIATALPNVQGKIIKEIDVKAGLDAQKEITDAQKDGAKVAFIALNRGEIDNALAIAKANADEGSPLMLLGGDELYGPDILIKGGDAIKGMVLAVPWSFQPSDPFALNAVKSWKGRVSWRTATAYDATQALADTVSKNSTRSQVTDALNQGVTLKNQNTNFSIFDEVPLVEAKKGEGGPAGSDYVFSPLPPLK